MKQALIVIDVQNEFSANGKRPVANHESALAAIKKHVERFRSQKSHVAWIRHHNKPSESPAFVPGTWGSEFSPGLGPQVDSKTEVLFEKDVYGAFSGTDLDGWLRSIGVDSVLLVGFYTHMCLSTAAREALIRGFNVYMDPEATGARSLSHPVLGEQTADEVRRSTLLHLTNMGARMIDGSQTQECLTQTIGEPCSAHGTQ